MSIPRAFFLLFAGFLLNACSGKNQATLSDHGKPLARLTFQSSHEFLGEYNRTITLYSDGKQKTLPYPPDTGGDSRLSITRHTGNGADYLRFQSPIYLLVFDLKALDYAKGSDRPENEIYTGKYTGPELPAVSASWVIDRDRRVTTTE